MPAQPIRIQENEETPAVKTPAAVAKPVETVYNQLDPFAGHWITSANVKHAGDIYGVQFRNGSARVEPLPRNADPEDIEERVNALQFFKNAHPYIQKRQRTDPDTGQLINLKPKEIPAYTVVPLSEAPRSLRRVQSDDETEGEEE